MASKRREILWCISNLVPRAFYFEFAPHNFKEKSPGNEVSSVHFFGIEWKLSYKYYMCVTPSVTFRTNKKIRKNSIAEIYTPRAGVSKGGGERGPPLKEVHSFIRPVGLKFAVPFSPNRFVALFLWSPNRFSLIWATERNRKRRNDKSQFDRKMPFHFPKLIRLVNLRKTLSVNPSGS